MEAFAIVTACGIGMAVLTLLFKPFFGNWEEFADCVRFWFTPDLFSLVRGEAVHDFVAELKLGIWFFCGGGCGYAAYVGLMKVFGPG
ncbi:MAG: hypothetical protein CMJ78_13895 [Planctomycetaceae bacterium]|nr:hypothetical protein [Planctomycetaceae bacterium]